MKKLKGQLTMGKVFKASLIGLLIAVFVGVFAPIQLSTSMMIVMIAFIVFTISGVIYKLQISE